MEMNDLMPDFSPTSRQQWIDQATKDLKGDSLASLAHQTADGISIAPFYTAPESHRAAPVFTHTDWEVCDLIVVHDVGEANKRALSYLNQGATSLIFELHDSSGLATLLQEVGIEYIAIQFRLRTDPTAFTIALDSLLAERKLDRSELSLTINYDPVGMLAESGSWPHGESESLQQFQTFIQKNPNCRNVCINSNSYHEAGATTGYEIGCALAHANEYLNVIDGKANGLTVQLNTATGADYFVEIAKLRAMRKVFAQLLSHYGVQEPVYIHATTAMRHLTAYDYNNNMLRGTTAAMAAVLGGCNSLLVTPYNVTFQEPDDFSKRLARNTQLILKGESYFDKISEVAAGAYYLETLTDELAQKGWQAFQEIEAAGGLIASLRSGAIQRKITESAAREQAKFDDGTTVLVGANKFAAMNEPVKNFSQGPLSSQASSGGQEAVFIAAPLIPARLAATLEQQRYNQGTLNA